MPRHADDHASEERRTEAAKLLAAGLLRFHRRVLTATCPASEFAQNPLDDVAETRRPVLSRSPDGGGVGFGPGDTFAQHLVVRTDAPAFADGGPSARV